MSVPNVDVFEQPDLVELLGNDPKLLAFADAIAQTQSLRPRRSLRGNPPRTVLLAASLAALAFAAIGIAAPALGLYRPLLNFFDQPAAPTYVQTKFDQLDRGVPAGRRGPGVLTGETRRVMDAQISRGTAPLWVAPTRRGHFCWLWGVLWGGCTGAPLVERPLREGELDPNALRLVYDRRWVAGVVLPPKARTISIEFADGTAVSTPLVWVSAPINAGFFSTSLVALSAEHGRAIGVVASDESGNIVSRSLLSHGATPSQLWK
jgi:hypothetical protein